MRRLAAGLALCFLLAAATDIPAATPPAAAPTPTAAAATEPVPSPHDFYTSYGDWAMHVTALVYLPDGKWIQAGYSSMVALHGSDVWSTWTTTWDLETGDRGIGGGNHGEVGLGAGIMPRAPENFTDTCGKVTAVSNHGKVIVSNDKKEPVATLPGGGPAAFSPDGKHLAVADARGIVRIWDWATGRLVRTLRLDDRKGDTVLVAAVQCASEFGEPAKNRTKLAEFVRRAAGNGAAIVVLPETAVTGYMTADLEKTWQAGKREITEGLQGVDPTAAAETVPGPSTEFFGKLADDLGIYLTVPLLEIEKKTGWFFNTSVLLGPDGRILLHYRKRDPWPWAEQGWATPGDLGNPVVDTPWGRLGLLVCFDIHEQAANMADKKIDTLLYSIAWVDRPKSDWFSKRLPAIAQKNGFNIIAANWTVAKDPPPDWHGYGQSRIIGRDGAVLAALQDPFESGIIYAELPIGPASGK